ncbi:N-(5-amino-5-carboxypentanoyl)-L-cysteinyl-D-valine synthase [Pochonia chlamydosporia 170]|uniref:N-(5-amino-5-carboxypentanoyl)-L-cysteinyl-D-valine synthase n=1 Tax=Pochonia chlamydosporia 170 TaxID=1380566 RepID=A0A179FQ76_METCM|nr:N-(5-amino-5-carboxypentanoyl)-L-cysteinyl-D-valine synthase [Pochonia chlamydosporia 170]OAQ67223.1 N-(5-amino-5-carboxypentanoyl)-L-cysteinyl-D-valine synthase [Pochonia chlamydosporia 170]
MPPPSEIFEPIVPTYEPGEVPLKLSQLKVNGNKLNGNGHANGTTGHEHISSDEICSPEYRIPSDSLEKWKDEVQNITERCDLSGLSREPVRYQLASTGMDGEALSMKNQSIDVSGRLFGAIKSAFVKSKVSQELILLFAVHQMLKGFGNGSHTVTASFVEQTNPAKPVWTVLPTIANHENQESRHVSAAIADMKERSQPDDHPDGATVVPSELVRQELLDLIVVFSKTQKTAPSIGSIAFPLVLQVNMAGSCWKLTMMYAESLFDAMVVDSFLSALSTLLRASTEPTLLLGDIELLPQDQVNQMEVWNNTDGEYPSTKRLHHLVEEAAERYPERVALICGEKRITYKELNAQANKLANYICSKSIQPEQLIGLFLDKSEMMIETILGVWKSGAAHVPIDPAYPNERVQFVLDDVKTKYIIASERHICRLRNEILEHRQIEIIPLESTMRRLAEQPLAETFIHLSNRALTSKQLAYVTYTSGTTGFPKGIYKEHTSVVNSITDLSTKYGVTGNDDEVILLFSAYVFEPFVRQMLMALTTGNQLAIIGDEDKFDPNTLLPYIRKHKVTYINGTASVLQEYDFTTCRTLKRIILVGENLTDSRYGALRRRFKGRIFNEYGFTESAFVTALKIFEPESQRLDMSLGRPVRNVKCYILDANLKRVPLGVSGELHIGGLGISRGYMNREELTRKKFLPNPYQTLRERELGVNGLLYKTGDLARWLPSGEVEYLGRIDFQIKLRGIRIEPGEIESTLALYPGVRTSIVVSKKLLSSGRETSQDHLVGYFVCDEKTLSENELLSFLEKKLPRYMVPTRLVQLPNIPVTINGKADLRALPIVDVAVPASHHTKRRDRLDEKLAAIWDDVLGVSAETMGLEQNFFRLGGHSITCIQLIARVRKHLGVGISIEEVFETRTLQAMADLLRLKTQENGVLVNGDRHDISQFIEHVETNGLTEARYMANSLQQGFVYHSLKSQQTDAYIMQSVLEYGLSLNEELYRAAWEHVHREYPALRIRFAWETDVMQVVDPEAKLDWRVIDGTNLQSEGSRRQLLDEKLRGDHAEGYHLNMGCLMRVYFIQMRGEKSMGIFSCHHSILDGWSLPLLFDHVHETYLSLTNGVKPHTDEESAYLDAQTYLQGHRDDHLEFWAKQIDQVEERCDLNALLNEASRYKVPLGDYDQIQEQKQRSIFLPRNASMVKLLEQCSAMGITLHSILQLIWHLVLHAYGGGSHTITGTTISGRNLPIEGIERSIGLFINTLPLILDHTRYRDLSALDAISLVQSQVNAMNSRGNVELGRLRKDDLKHGLFDTLFVLENYPNLDESRREQHKALLKYRIVGGTEKLSYPLAVVAQEVDDKGCDFTICYASELFGDDTIQVLLQTVHDTLENIARDAHAPIRDIEYLSIDQLKQLDKWNSTSDEFPSGTLHSLFETEAQQKPSKTAVIYEHRKLTYHELNCRSNSLAYHLLAKAPIKPNKLVALVIEKSEHLITSILAVWKSGGAYVPIDPSYPDDRIKYILDDTSALAIIADEKYLDRLASISEGNSIPIISSETGAKLPPSPTHPVTSCTAMDLAYVMYTSGTTGRPKGVMVEHHGVVNLAVSLSKIFGLRDTVDEVILSFSNYVFDHFVEQMTDALLNGQTLLVLNDEMRGDKERLYQYIETNRVTYLSGTPSVISMYEFSRFRNHLRRIDCVGEAFSEPVFDKIRESFPGLIINGYGPTEVSITTHKRLYPFPERRTDKSIGKQVANSTSYVLNDDMKRVPIGAVGELYLGGDGVARGYHNRADLTAERFPPNPFQTEQEKIEGRNARLYKTGDLVRWIESADGEVEYLGRNDFQVKIRGQRIELGEIEAILCSYPEIEQSIVLAKERPSDGQKYLIGYYVSSGLLSPQAIRRFLQSRLPTYMVPSRLMAMDKFPVTVSGKLDSKALPVPEDTAEDEVVPPRTEIEKILAKIWAGLLDIPVESISIYSDFFGLGGDSLRSTKLSFAAMKALGVSVTVNHLFKYPTIEAFARWIAAGATEVRNLAPLAKEALVYIPVSPAQERLLFLQNFAQDGNAYNISFLQELDTTVCLTSLENAVKAVVGRHESLRTVLVRPHDSSKFQQKILSEDDARNLLLVDILQPGSEDDMQLQMAKAVEQVFCLESEPPFKMTIYRLAHSKKTYCSFVFHHIAFDAWSWELFRRDLMAYYDKFINHQSVTTLPILPVQYKEYAVEHRQTLSSRRYEVLSEFWKGKLEGFTPLSLATDKPRPSRFDYIGSDLRLSVDSDLASKLRNLAKHEGASLYTVMLAAYCYLLSVYTMQDTIAIGVPASHRSRLEYESVIGFFVNLLPLQVTLGDVDVRGLIASVQRQLVDAQIHMDMPFQDIVKLSEEIHDPSRHPLVQTVFNWETESGNSQGADEAGLLCDYSPTIGLASVAKFDLNVTVAEQENGAMQVNFNYATSLFEECTIRSFMHSYQQILQRLADVDVRSSISGLLPATAITYQDYHQHSDTPKVPSLAALFENQVSLNSEQIAVVGDKCKISYGDLNARANQLAHWILANIAVKKDDPIALMLGKGIDMIVSILAVWKAGAAYVPLDPDYPTQRTKHILEQTKAKLLITSSSYKPIAEIAHDIQILMIDNLETSNAVKMQPSTNPALPTGPTPGLAYIIFTSGTTGKPKGVLVEQQSVTKFCETLARRYFGATNSPQAILFLSNYVFDFSIEQIGLSILSGNKLIIPPDEGITHESFYEMANMERLSYLSGTPSVLQQIQLSRLQHLQMITAAGEEFHSSQYDNIRAQFKGPVNNAYGVTETTVYNLVTGFPAGAAFNKALCDELPGSRAYVLNDRLQHVPLYAVGELYIAGDCIARGYLNQTSLTMERFVANPIDTNEAFRTMYKTGDLVRYCGPGRIEYIGRRDQQVKLRGFRIELSEVQACLASVQGVREAAVVPHYEESNQKSRTASKLIAYYTLGDGCSKSTLDVHHAVATKLPNFMIPSNFHHVEGSLPVTINGKLDVKRLATLQHQQNTVAYTAPRNLLEVKLCQLWASAVGSGCCGIDDDLFKMGGDSLTSLQLVGDIHRQLGRKVTIKDLFLQRTVRAIHDNVFAKDQNLALLPRLRADQGLVEGDAPMLPIQNWFLVKKLKHPAFWNHCFSIRTPQLDIDKLKRAVGMLQDRHDVLRMRLHKSSGRYKQTFPMDFERIELQALDWQSEFDFEHGPLFSMAYLHGYEDGSARIWCSFHHLIMDSVSWSIIKSDLHGLYHGMELGMKSSSVQQWALAVQQYTMPSSERIYWKEQRAKTLQGAKVPPQDSDIATYCEEKLSQKETISLLQHACPRLGVGMLDVLLTAVGYTLQQVKPGSPSMVTIEGHGREESVDPSLDVSRTIGWFTSMYPFEIPQVNDLVQGPLDVKQSLKKVPNKGIGYGPCYGYLQDSLPPISVNYLGRIDQSRKGRGDWYLVLGETELRPGLYTHPEDRGRSSSMVDITFAVANEQLTIDMSSCLDETTNNSMLRTIKGTLQSVIDAAMAEDLPTQTDLDVGLVFTPYFAFDDGDRQGPYLFMLPPGEGGAESYFHNVVQGLPNQRLIVFNNHYRDCGTLSTFEGLAEYYISHIREVQPEGPYHMLGWSFGGILGMEIAQRLANGGDKIGTMALIDPYFDIPWVTREIGEENNQVLDQIYYNYRPDPAGFRAVEKATDQLVLFKAGSTEGTSGTPTQRQLYEWYAKSSNNNLENYVSRSRIEFFPLQGTHFTWVNYSEQVRRMCQIVSEGLNKRKS